MEISEGTDPTLDGLVNDKVNDAYGFFYASSMFVAPLLGSEVFTLTDAETTATYFAAFGLFFGFVSLFFNATPFVFSRNRKFNEKLKELREKSAEVLGHELSYQGSESHYIHGSIHHIAALGKRTTSMDFIDIFEKDT